MYQKVNIINIPLDKICVIEASAGTGKTFTISLLYIRTLLGINTKKYPIQKILVVTFTKLAQEELLYRIQQYINILKIACIQKKIEKTSILNQLFKNIHDVKKSYIILQNAENNINNLAIYTIDKFFQKISILNIFNFNLIHKNTIINNKNSIYLQSTILYWKKYYYNVSKKITYIIYTLFNNPYNLLKIILLQKNIINKHKKYNNSNINIIYQDCENFYKKIKIIKKIWILEKDNILNSIQNSDVNKKIYNNKNLLKWINKISIWANIKNNIEKYSIPIELKYFTQNKINIKNTKYNKKIFEKIENIFNMFTIIKKKLTYHALYNINQITKKIKKKNYFITFDEIAKKIYKCIIKSQYSIRIFQNFPIAFIDECQDIDDNQLKLFYKIYIKNQYPIILIGDPKQSIYSFRNSNISRYLKVISKIKIHYSLNINWRSSKIINDGINNLFNNFKYPFIIKQIKFFPTISPKQNYNISFHIKNKDYSGIHLIYHQKPTNITDFQEWISEQCAKNISYWLENINTKQAVINKNNNKKILNIKDIVILVNNKIEAEIIQNKLNDLNITSVYSSNNKNIYKSTESHELLWILEAILNINNINLIKKACFTEILSIKISYIKNIEYDIKKRSLIIKKFIDYYNIWKNYGILNLIKYIIIQNNKNNNFFNIHTINTIGEILQTKSTKYINIKELVVWFKKKIFEVNDIQDKKKILPYYDNENIKIFSIHKAKGLEFPIVWIPFGIYNTKYIEHKKNKIFFNNDNLSEKIRLLYVACTRAIIHCSIGLTTLKSKINNYSNIHHTALGYIIQNGMKMSYLSFCKNLEKIKNKKIINVHYGIQTNNHIHSIKKTDIIKTNKIYKIYKTNNLKIQYNTSFSNMKKILYPKINNMFNENIMLDNIKKNIFNIHNFPTGKKYGIFLHNILNKINFHKTIDKNLLCYYIKKINISKKWVPVIEQWINNILKIPIKKNSNMNLMNLKTGEYIKELKFSIPINKKITKIKLHNFLKSHYHNYEIQINNIQGMLNGSIDLIILWNKKYYLIDYKSNWLGKNNSFYNINNINKEIIEKKYYLQYQIYSLALHKYLKIKMKHYSFNNNFGGIFYIFLRSIEENYKNDGIFFYLPKKYFINNLNDLLN